jgi:hypothetical protein
MTNIPLGIAAQLPGSCRAIETAEHHLIDYARSLEATVADLRKLYEDVD